MVPLRKPTADSSVLIEAARAGVRRFYEPGYQLKKAGVILLDLSSSSVHQAELELGGDDCKDQTQLMMTVDQLNRRFGRGAVSVGGTGMSQKGDWSPKQMRLTPQYTTKLSDIPVARA